MWHAAMEQMKRRGRGNIEGIERMREIALWRRDSPLSGTQEACQGLNDITLHVIYFMALGGCPMCQEMHKILTAILTLLNSWPINTLVSHSKCDINPSMLNIQNELITWCFNCSAIIALVHRITKKVKRYASEDDSIMTGLVWVLKTSSFTDRHGRGGGDKDRMTEMNLSKGILFNNSAVADNCRCRGAVFAKYLCMLPNPTH